MTAEDVQKRVNEGYTMALYGTRENIHSQMLADIITLLESQPKWIPVGERLPEYNEDVLTYNVNGEQKIGYYSDFISDFMETKDNGDDLLFNVIAWQPLPEPYRA